MLEQQMQQLEATRAQLAQQMAQLQEVERMANRMEPGPSTALPKDGMLKVFTLRYTKAPDAARVVSEILGGDIARMAVDERTNSLLVFAKSGTVDTVEALVQTLDQRTGDTASEKARPGETLQLRVVWLLDIDEGMDPTDELVSPQVVDALEELGFSTPKVVCQQVTTLTLGDDGGRSRRGQFNFDVPVLIGSQSWQLEGQGEVQSMADERFNLRFEMRFVEMLRQDRPGRPPRQGRLGGSIYTPLGHYTVMGTTTFVAVIPHEDAVNERQHLSAFVVYLDRAKEYPASESPSNNRNDARR
jgi:hypothetical protein